MELHLKRKGQKKKRLITAITHQLATSKWPKLQTLMQQECFCSAFWELMINVGEFSALVTPLRGLLMPVDGTVLEMRNTFDEIGHLFRMCLCSATGGEWESGRKFCQAASKFCSVCVLKEFPADYTEVLGLGGPVKEEETKKNSPVSHHLV